MKKRIVTIVVTGILASWTFHAYSQTRTPMQLLGMGQYLHARDAFIGDLRKNNTAANWYYLGKIYNELGKRDSANYCLNSLTQVDPKSSLATALQLMNQPDPVLSKETVITLEKAQKTATSAKDITALVALAEARFKAGDTLSWIEPLKAASDIDKKNTLPYITAGKLYAILGARYTENSYNGLAAGRFEQALYYDAQNLEAKTRLADIYVLARNYQDAENKLDEVLAKDSTYIPALKIMGELCYSLGKYEKASHVYGAYIRTGEINERDLIKYINILYFNKEYAEANQIITRVLSSNPGNPVLYRLKGYTSFELGNFTDGLEAMNKFFEIRSAVDTSKIIPTDYEYLGKLQSKTDLDSLAVISLAKANELDPNKPGLLEDIAKLYEKQKKYKSAVEYYEKFSEAKGGSVSSSTYFNIGKDLLILANDCVSTADSLLRPQYLTHADSAFTKVVNLSPNSYLGYLWRARVRAGLDPETLSGIAKSDYEQSVTFLEAKNDNQKYGKDLIEALRYMGYYYYLQFDNAAKVKDEAAKEQARNDSSIYWQKILVIDPANEIAKQALNALKK